MPTPSGRPSMMDAILAGEIKTFQAGNRDASYREPVRSMVDGSQYTNKGDYLEHLKRNNCEIVDADSNDNAWKDAHKLNEIKPEKITIPDEIKGI